MTNISFLITTSALNMWVLISILLKLKKRKPPRQAYFFYCRGC